MQPKTESTRIHGYRIELEIEDDNGDIVSSCWVSLSFANSARSYCSSLALLESLGILEADGDHDDKEVPEATIAKIAAWAYDHGY